MSYRWKIKAIVQKAISFLPFREKVNFLFQKYVTKGVLLTDEHFELKLTHAQDHLSYFRKYGDEKCIGKTALELGSGWYPIVPIAMFLNGFDRIISIDIQSWMTKESLLETIGKFLEWKKQGKLQHCLHFVNPKRWDKLVSVFQDAENLQFDEICNRIYLELLLKDARASGFEAHSVDFICSNNTLEHIPEKMLTAIFREFKRILRQDGMMSHFIDLSDHFAHFDKSITIYNFLQYSDRQWNWIDNRIQPQNRLRFRDYKKIYENLQISFTEEAVRPGELKALQKIKPAGKFEKYTPEELAVSHGYLVSWNFLQERNI